MMTTELIVPRILISLPYLEGGVNRAPGVWQGCLCEPVALRGVTDASSRAAEPARLTPETHARLQAELEDLTTRGRVEIAQAIEAARALGDLSENGDYHAAKDTQGKMESRIRQLQALLKDAEVVEAGGAGDGTVRHGVVVTLRYDGDDDTQDFFVGSIEEHRGDMPVVSPSAPLGQALIGRTAGDTVDYDSPGGKLTVEIVKVGA
jgi:transcription elongation factor GreA